MTTALEIIDTAVKISFGAIVSGIATYLVTKESNKQEIRKNLCLDRKDLLLEITRKIDNCTTVRNSAIANISLKIKSGIEDIDEELLSLNSASSELKLAASNAYLIGNLDLAGHVKELFDLYAQEQDLFFEKNTQVDASEINVLGLQREVLLKNIREEYKSALDQIYV